MKPVVFLHTSDPVKYADMMAATSRTVRAYCARHDYSYESYLGIKRGNVPWHACFNRCYMLSELMSRGYRGWAIYLDADAYIADMNFDLDALLREHSDKAAIMSLSEAGNRRWYDVNSGVVFLNFSHPIALDIVQRWRGMIDAVPSSELRLYENFNTVIGDQLFLQTVLQGTPEAEAAIHNPSSLLINSPNASFIRQCLRGVEKELDRRIAMIQNEVDAIMGSTTAPIIALPRSEPSSPHTVDSEMARSMTTML